MLENVNLSIVLTWLSQIINTPTEAESGVFFFQIDGIESGKGVTVTRTEIEESLIQLARFKELEESGLYNSSSLEVHVRVESRILGYSRLREGDLKIEDSDNGLLYELSHPSLAYIFYIINKASQVGAVEDLLRGSFSKHMIRRRFEDENCKTLGLAEFFYYFIIYLVNILLYKLTTKKLILIWVVNL